MNRDLLFDVCDQLRGWEAGAPEPTVEVDGQPILLREALGSMWNDTDRLPAQLRSAVTDFVERRDDDVLTYAAAARALMAVVKTGAPAPLDEAIAYLDQVSAGRAV